MHISAWLDCLTKFPNHITMHQSRACAGICRALQGHDKVEGCSAMGLYRKGMKEQVVGIRGAGQEPYQTVKHGCVTEIGWHAWPLLIKLQSHAKYSIQQFAWLKSDILDMSGLSRLVQLREQGIAHTAYVRALTMKFAGHFVQQTPKNSEPQMHFGQPGIHPACKV